MQYGKYFSSSFCFRHIARAEGECNIGNKMNEKNISHIARNCHAITYLSLGESTHCRSRVVWRFGVPTSVTIWRRIENIALKLIKLTNCESMFRKTPFLKRKLTFCIKTSPCIWNLILHCRNIENCTLFARIWDICTPY